MNQPNSLSELVELAIRHRDTSGLGLSQLAVKHGYQLTATTINQIRQGLYKSKPRESTIRALAWLAGVSDEVAFTAAGQPVPGPPFAEELPPGVDNLPPKARKAAIDMLRVLVDLNKDADEAEQAERQAAREARDKLLRDSGYVSARQKTEHTEPDDESSLAKKRAAGESIRARTLRAVDYPNNNIPLPDDYEQLAAHPLTDSSGRREHEAGGGRGEESQETSDEATE